MIVACYMLLGIFYAIFNSKTAHREKWFILIMIIYLMSASFILTDTFLDFTLVVTSSLLLYLMMQFSRREFSASVILVLTVMTMMLAVLVGLVEKSSLQPMRITCLVLYGPVLIFVPKWTVHHKRLKVLIWCMIIFSSGIFMTSLERNGALDHKVMYVAENYLSEHYGQKKWTITCGPGSRFEKTLVFATVEDNSYYLIYYKGKIVDRL